MQPVWIMRETTLHVRLLALLTILALPSCTPKPPVFAASTEMPGENSVTIVQASTELVAKSVTLVATESAGRAEGPTSMERGQSVLEFTEANSGQSIEIPPGTFLVLRLKGQPSTGYTWVIVELNRDVLAQDGEPQYATSGSLRGAEQEMVWKFKAASAGDTALKLVYIRTFEKNQPPSKIFELTVKVSNR